VIEDDVKLDNQIQIGHNCVIGAHHGDRRLRRHRRIDADRPSLQDRRRGDDQRTSGDRDGTVDLGGTGVYDSIHERGPIPARSRRCRIASGNTSRRTCGALPRAGETNQGARRGRARSGATVDRGAHCNRSTSAAIMRHLPPAIRSCWSTGAPNACPASRSAAEERHVNEPFFQGHFPGFR